MRTDGTAEVIMRYVASSGDTDPVIIGRETGIPAYIVRRYFDAITRGFVKWQKAQHEQEGGASGE